MQIGEAIMAFARPLFSGAMIDGRPVSAAIWRMTREYFVRSTKRQSINRVQQTSSVTGFDVQPLNGSESTGARYDDEFSGLEIRDLRPAEAHLTASRGLRRGNSSLNPRLSSSNIRVRPPHFRAMTAP
jgi:hypothetical protein